jgi:hypothetical protein
MTNGQENHLNMQLTTAAFCTDNLSVVNTLPSFGNNLQILTNANTQIQTSAESQGTGTSGITWNKKQLRLNVNALASDSARKLTSFAILNDNFTLLGEVNYTESDFKRFSDIEARDHAQIVYNKANDNLPLLLDYTINPATQTALQNAIQSFSSVITAPRIGATAKSQATKQLVNLFKTAETALGKMDAAVELLRLTEPNFYNGYKSARKILNKGTGKLAVKGSVSDSKTGEPIKGVTVAFMPNGEPVATVQATNGQIILSKVTADKGGFNIKSIPAGTYHVSFKKAGYAEQIVTVNVNDGELTVVDTVLEKI